MPIFLNDSAMTGLYLLHGSLFRETWKTFLHAGASQIPSLSVSYLDAFMASLALASSSGYGS